MVILAFQGSYLNNDTASGVATDGDVHKTPWVSHVGDDVWDFQGLISRSQAQDSASVNQVKSLCREKNSGERQEALGSFSFCHQTFVVRHLLLVTVSTLNSL